MPSDVNQWFFCVLDGSGCPCLSLKGVEMSSRGMRRPCGRGHAQLLFDFAPGGACHAVLVAKNPVRSYRTFSPYPRQAGLFDLCGAVPWIAPAGRYPAPLSHGVRTFLAVARLPDHPQLGL